MGAQGKAAGIFPVDLARVLLSATRADWEQIRRVETPPAEQFVADLQALGGVSDIDTVGQLAGDAASGRAYGQPETALGMLQRLADAKAQSGGGRVSRQPVRARPAGPDAPRKHEIF